MVSGEQPGRARKVLPLVMAGVLAIALIVGLRYWVSGGSGGGGAPAGGDVSTCGNADVTVQIASSPEKAGLLQEAARSYGTRSFGGRCVGVAVQSKSSGVAMQALARGWDPVVDGPAPDVWSPAAASWVNLVRVNATGDHATVLPEGDQPSVATSPLVIAMPKPMAQALGWPGRAIGWSDLSALATDPAGWAKHGHPEWGRFRLGKTNPNVSTSGMNATIGAYYAATGTSSDLTAAAVQQPRTRQFVTDIEASIVHYGDNTLTFLTNLQQADDRGVALSYVSAVTVEENSLAGYNQGNPTNDPAKAGQHGPPKVPLVAIYPSDGTLRSDHPFVILKSAEPVRHEAAADFLAYLRGPEIQQRFLDLGFRGFDGRTGPALDPASGILPDERINYLRAPSPPVLAELLKSWADVRKKANVLLVMDVSGSMAESVPGTGLTKMDLAKRAAAEGVGQFEPRDQVGLWMFSTRLDGDRDFVELRPVGPLGDTGRAQLQSTLRGLTPQAGTGLYDSTLAAYQQVSTHLDPSAINAVVVLTDGHNEDPVGIDLPRLLGALSAEGNGEPIRVFTIGYGADADQGVLRQIASATRGSAYDSSKPDTINQVFSSVISNF